MCSVLERTYGCDGIWCEQKYEVVGDASKRVAQSDFA